MDAFPVAALQDVSAPVIDFSTYLGGLGSEGGSAVVTDASGDIYVLGGTNSADLPGTRGRTVYRGSSDVFVAKLSGTSGALLYATYLGGSGFDTPGGLAVDSQGHAYVTGQTKSVDFPVTPGALDRTCGTDGRCNPFTYIDDWEQTITDTRPDAFVARVDAAGELVAATYLGGSHADSSGGLTLGRGELHIAGTTASRDFPTARPLQATLSGDSDAFVLSLDFDLQSIGFSTYWGGNRYDGASAVAWHPAGYLAVAGTTRSADFPLKGALFSRATDGDDAFVLKLTSDGTQVVFSTRLGDTGTERAGGVAMDEQQQVIVAGETTSTDFPLQRSTRLLSGSRDAFVTKLSADGAMLVYSRLIGGTGYEFLEAVSVDRSGNAYVTGQTSSADFPSVNSVHPQQVGTVYLSTDAGATYRIGGIGLEARVLKIAIVPGSSATVYATYSDYPRAGVAKSLDGGLTWTGLVSAAFASDLAIDPTSNGAIVYALLGVRVVRTTDGGAHWQTVLDSAGLAIIEADPVTPGVIYAGFVDGRVLRSSDRGDSWTALGRTPSSRIWDIAVDPSSPSVLYLGGETGVLKSTDAGQTWVRLSVAAEAAQVVVDPTNSAVVYAVARRFTQGLYKSTDGAASWQLERDDEVQTIVLDRKNPRRLYAATRAGVFVSDDAADTWRLTGLPHSFTIDVVSGTDVVIAGGFGGLDAYVAAVSASGDDVFFSTHLGGRGQEGGGGIALAPDGAVVVTGGTVSVDYPTVLPTQAAPSGGIGAYFPSEAFVTRIQMLGDSDRDAMGDAWERRFGLDSAADDARADPDGDGVTNLQEYRAGSHPRGFYSRRFAEGAGGPFFETSIAMAYLSDGAPARMLVRYLKPDGTQVPRSFDLAAWSRRSLDADPLAGLAGSGFATIIESDRPIVADRTMKWDATHYGSHSDSGIESPSLLSYLAEGATHSGFQLFYLIHNPGKTDAAIEVRYLRPEPTPPVVRTYRVAANSRFNIWVNREAGLEATDVSAVIRSVNAVPVVVERSMYRDAGGQRFGAGHSSAAVSTTSPIWYFAEGATGRFFDQFLLLMNPDDREAVVETTYQPPGDAAVPTIRQYVLPPGSRRTIWVDGEGPALAETAVSMVVRSVNGVGVVAERTMWWPGSPETWHEAHNVAGITRLATRWGIGDGETGGREAAETFILIGCCGGPNQGDVRVTLIFDDGQPVVRTFTISAGRFTIDVASEFAEAVGRRFSALIESVPRAGVAAGLIVERATYSSSNGVVWAAGSAATATELPATVSK